jgi:hypothetical protein
LSALFLSRFDTWRARPQLNRETEHEEENREDSKRVGKKILVRTAKYAKIGKIIISTENQKVACARSDLKCRGVEMYGEPRKHARGAICCCLFIVVKRFLRDNGATNEPNGEECNDKYQYLQQCSPGAMFARVDEHVKEPSASFSANRSTKPFGAAARINVLKQF